MNKDLSYSFLDSKIKIYSSRPISAYKKRTNIIKHKRYTPFHNHQQFINETSLKSSAINQNNEPNSDSTKNLKCSYSTNCLSQSTNSLRYNKMHLDKKIPLSPSISNSFSLRKIITDHTKHFLNSIDKDNSRFSIASDDDSLRNLEEVLFSIKSKAFESVQNEIEEKKVVKAALESSIEQLKHQIHIYHNTKKYWTKANAKVEIDIKTLNKTSHLYVNDLHEIDVLKKDIEPFQNQINALNDYTTQLRALYLDDKKTINHCEDQIQKINKSIGEIEREKDILRTTIQVILNHNKKLTSRIKTGSQKNSEVMLQFTSLCKKVVK